MNWKKNLHPEFVRRVLLLIELAKADGVILTVTSGFRSHAEQNKLYAKGRTTGGKRVTNAVGGQSWHNFGVAVDLAPIIDGKISFSESFKWSQIGKWAKAVNLEWGGNWKSFPDRPHVQLVADLTTRRANNLYKKSGNDLVGVWEYITKNATPIPTAKKKDAPNDLQKIALFVQPEIEPVETGEPTATAEPQPAENQSQPTPSEPNQAPAENPPTFTPDDKSLEAPPKEGSTATATQMTIAGIAVPACLVGIIKVIQDLVTQGVIDAKQLGDTIISFLMANIHYVFYAIVALIVFLAVKKLCKQITLWIQMFINSNPNWHNITVEAAPKSESGRILTFRQRLTGKF